MRNAYGGPACRRSRSTPAAGAISMRMLVGPRRRGPFRSRENGILFIENIGNLVCPSGFDLGETTRVVILSVTEGDDKPIKYPDAFASADVMVLSKVDLLPHVDFDAAAAAEYARSVNPDIKIINSSTRTSPGIGDWLDWLLAERRRILETASRQPIEPPAETNGLNPLVGLEASKCMS